MQLSITFGRLPPCAATPGSVSGAWRVSKPEDLRTVLRRAAARCGPRCRLASVALCLAGLLSTAAHAQNGPLGNFLKDLFGTGTQTPRTLDLIDRHAAAASRELSRGLEQSDSLIAMGQWGPAIQQLQFLVDLPEDALTLQGTTWRSIKRAAEERLLRLPDEGRRAYLNQYEQVAADELARARATDDFAALVQVAARFRLTPSGQTAADEAASLLADAGDLVAAAQWYAELEADRAAVTSSPAWKLRVAAVRSALGLDAKTQPAASSAGDAGESSAVVVRSAASAGWTEIYGGPGRWNAVPGGHPLLLEEWSSPAAQATSLQNDLQQRQADLFANHHRPLPVANMVSSGGLLAVRTPGGLEARRVDTGELLWSARGRATAEAVLSRTGGETGHDALSLVQGDNHEAHPLSSFLYRDATIGQLSSDGRRLFAIARQATLLSSAFDLYSVSNAFDYDDHSFNRITALDFRTGRTLWSTGGSRSDRPFESPLSGVYFFGPPTVDGDELFVIGAAGADIHLYCLEAATGLPRWKQFIAQYDSTKIEDDTVRQMWACTPAVTRGLVYCPTNSGWLVAVDRHRRRLAWATRYATGNVSDRYQPQYSLTQLNERWHQSAPIVANGQVVFAPPELPDEPMQTEPQLFRIDAVTGKVLFRRGKADSIAVGGVYGENVLVIGKTALESWPVVARWSARWSTPYPAGLTPCGLGIAIQNVYWLPCLEGAVIGFRLSDGGIEQVLRNDGLAGRLGNLIVADDRIVSAGPTGLVGLWQKEPFERQLADRLAQNPRDLEARVRIARGHMSEQQFERALNELDVADLAGDARPDLVQAARDLQWECLVELLSRTDAPTADRWKQLEALSDSPARQQVVSRLQIDRALAADDWSAALERCWSALTVADGDIRDGGLQVREDVWLAGRLLDLWRRAPETIRAELSTRIGRKIAEAGPDLAVAGPRLETLFGFHPQGRRLSLELAVRDSRSAPLAVSESRLLPLSSAPEIEVAASAASRLAGLYRRHGCAADAARLAAIAAAFPGDTPLLDGDTLEQWKREWKGEREPTPPAALPQWDLANSRVLRLGAERSFEIGRAIRLDGRPAAWLAQRRLEFATSWYGLVVVDPATARREWTMPLAANGGFEEDWSPIATAAGSMLAVCSRGMVHVCSPRDGHVLWSWPLPTRFSNVSAYAWAEEYLANQPARTASVAVNEFQANVRQLREGPLLAIAGERLVILGQHELVVFDVRTGVEQWRRTGIAPTAVLVADENAVCVSSTTAGGPAAFRLLDGKPIFSEGLPAAFARTFAVEGNVVLTRQGLPSLLSSGVRLVAERPFSAEALWSHSVTADTVVQHLPGRELGGVAPNGDVFVIDVDTGQRSPVGRLASEQLAGRRSIHLLADAERVYVAIQRQQSYDFSNLRLSSITLNGDIVAFDRRQGRMLWRERVRDTSLVTASFADLPILLLVEQFVPERRRSALDALQLPELKLTALDKATGTRVIEWAGVTPQGTPAALLFDPRRQRIDLFLNHYNQNFNDRLRLQFGAAPPLTVP